MPSPATDVPQLLRRLSADPGRPRLTWYGPDGERVELSGHVLDNWVTKTTNLLVEEHDAGPHTTVVLDLPVHWRAVVWSLAAWRTGALLRLVSGEPEPIEADVAVTARPQHWAGTGAEVIAVALPALARTFGGTLPAGTTDAASAVMTYPDQLGWVPATDLSAPALDLDPEPVAYGNLLRWATDSTARSWPGLGDHEVEAGSRVLLDPGADVPEAAVLAAALAAYAADGSVVLCDPSTTTELAAEPGRRSRLIETERITRHRPLTS